MKRASFEKRTKLRKLFAREINTRVWRNTFNRANINFLFLFLLLLLNQLFQFFFLYQYPTYLSSLDSSYSIFPLFWDPRSNQKYAKECGSIQISFIPYNFRFDKLKQQVIYFLFFPSILESRHTPRSRNRVT